MVKKDNRNTRRDGVREGFEDLQYEIIIIYNLAIAVCSEKKYIFKTKST